MDAPEALAFSGIVAETPSDSDGAHSARLTPEAYAGSEPANIAHASSALIALYVKLSRLNKERGDNTATKKFCTRILKNDAGCGCRRAHYSMPRTSAFFAQYSYTHGHTEPAGPKERRIFSYCSGNSETNLNHNRPARKKYRETILH
jgi:hypothetical protein